MVKVNKYMAMEDLTLVGAIYRMQYTGDVPQNGTLETYIILLTMSPQHI